jgi:hypothetical protein
MGMEGEKGWMDVDGDLDLSIPIKWKIGGHNQKNGGCW